MATTIANITSRLKFIKFSDIIQIVPMVVGAIGALFLKVHHKNIWLVCERKSDARDNGYWFFKYMREQHPEIETIYAIDEKSPDYQKVASLGTIIQFGSLTHWIYYWAAKKNISSQKEGKPNAALCMLLEVFLGFRQNRVYLKHGIIKDYQQWVFKNISRFNLIICGAKREYDYMLANFGYSEKEFALTGLSRFDNLLTPHEVKRQILVMPTQREWLRVISSDTLKFEGSYEFTDSEYFKTWSSFVHSNELSLLLNEYNIDLIFYLHASMQKYAERFKAENPHIKIGYAKDYDVQELLMESAMLVTDYSSIYFDFAYMKKPLVYYQFDYEKYRKGQYQEGYFSYEKDGFGPVVCKEGELISQIRSVLTNGLKMEVEYETKVNNFFPYNDNNNCERIYQAICEMTT